MKIKVVLVIVNIFILSFAYSQQTVTGVSGSKFVNISKDPPKPPYLTIDQKSIEFTEPSGNRKIDANESDHIRFKLSNSGAGPGLGLKAIARETSGMIGLNFQKETQLSRLDVGQSVSINIPVSGGMNLPDGKAVFSIYVSEPNGFGTDPFIIEIPTQPFQAPLVQVVDYQFSSQTSSLIEKRRPFDLELMIQNTGRGDAQNVVAKLKSPDNVFLLSANEVSTRENLSPGESFVVSYNLITNNDFSAQTIPFTIELSEKYSKYANNKSIQVEMNQPVTNTRLTVQGKEEASKEIVIGSLMSSVDKNIPLNHNKNPNRIALIIGNEIYDRTLNAEINVDYALHDAEIFRQYVLNTLGVEPANVIILSNATSGQMNREIDRVSEMLKRIGSKAELIFYYAGHGFPDEVSGVPYLIPVDVDATNLGSAVKLASVYQKFSNTGAARITVFLDACFSGGGRNQGLLTARGVKIKPKQEAISGNMVVFSATSGEQSALPYASEKHGMFTYFLLKELQQTSGEGSYGQLENYLRKQVGLESLRTNRKPQDPEVNVSPAVENSWQEWNLN